MPEDPIVEQEADPTAMPPNYEEDKNLGDNDTKEPEAHMYFIATGKCYVEVQTDFNIQLGDSNAKQKVNTLLEGSYFGEISVLFGCKRTASVVSNSYCTLAFISKKKLTQLQSQYEKLISTMKKHVVLY